VSPAADPRLAGLAAAHPYPLAFASLSGAHLYGFPSRDSDFDLRGVHVLPLAEVVGLRAGPATIERMGEESGLELDLVTHDLCKFARMLLQPNGYVLEQLHSPLVVVTTPVHAELRELARGCVTRAHGRHYLGFAATQWQLFAGAPQQRVKPLLYVYRVLLTGLHLLRTGEVVADLRALAAAARMDGIEDLIAQKTGGSEQAVLREADVERHRREYERLRAELERAMAESPLPAAPSAERALHDLVVRVRLDAR